jgi:hypothetical protein
MTQSIKWRPSNPDAGERTGLQVGEVDGNKLFTIRRTDGPNPEWALTDLSECQEHLHGLFCDCLEHADTIYIMANN